MNKTVFAVTTAKGPGWMADRGLREQPGWDAHATYFDSLVDQGVVILGGPITSPDPEVVALLAVAARDEPALREVFAADPWAHTGVLRVKDVHEWKLWLDSRS